MAHGPIRYARATRIPGKVVADVRLPGVVAGAALIAALASVVVPGLVGSRTPSAPLGIDAAAFRPIALDQTRTSMTTNDSSPAIASASRLDAWTILRDPRPDQAATVSPRAQADLPVANPIVQELWTYDPEISWYGPGEYGDRTACGVVFLQRDTIGVAHRSLPCGTKVTFQWNGKTVVTQVIDRGPYVPDRIFDLTRGACAVIDHCWTGPIWYRIG